ncbi:hypothetical protein BGZ73_002296 [Actinomortierella ambigua]|nr:hypothetical protein BGZ73_002296 [Actinomortierella ambigua]
MGVQPLHIQVAGRWATGSGHMYPNHLDTYPIDCAFALAGFMDRPFYLRRSEAHPSNELQRQIFPFVEEALFTDGSQEREEWVKLCTAAMEETLCETKQPRHTINVQPWRNLEAMTRGESSTSQFSQQQDFLLMLVSFKAFQEEVSVCLERTEPAKVQDWPPESVRKYKLVEESMRHLGQEVKRARDEHRAIMLSFMQEQQNQMR